MDIPLIDLGADALLQINESIDDKKQIHAYKLLCNSCLCVGRTLHEVTDDKMARFYLEALRELPLYSVPALCPSICWECKAALKKAATFKQQVQDSYRILQTYTNENLHEYLLTDIVRSSGLQIQARSPVSINPEEDVEQNDKGGRESLFFKGELKIEWDGKVSESNADITRLEDISLSDCDAQELETEVSVMPAKKKKKEKNKSKSKMKNKIKRAEKVVKRLQNGIKNSKKPKPAANQKILTLELSYEEMLCERARDASRAPYADAPYKCASCVLGFAYRRSYDAHNAAKHSPDLGNYICPICKTIISSVESFTSHYKRHMRRYECATCGWRGAGAKAAQHHHYAAHGLALKRYRCDVCGKVSNSIDTHRYHKDTHKARVQCPECDKTFTHRAGLLNHRLSVHELRNAFPCPVCGKVFRWKTSLKRHQHTHALKDNNGAAAAYCVECEVSFASTSSYQRHLKNSLKHVTQEQLRFICDHCERRFADKTKLRDHIEEKHLHKTYQCHICLKPSKNRVALDQHVRNVHRGRPNNKICHHCGKGFPTKVQLETHIRTHTGERPFICEHCPTTFSQQSNLYKHYRQVHLNIKSKRYPICKKRKEGTPNIMYPAPTLAI